MCQSSVTPVTGPIPSFQASHAQMASRLASLSAAASLIISGSGCASQLQAENIVIDLMDLAADIASAMAHHFDQTLS